MFTSCLFFSQAGASINFDSSKKYRITCKYYGMGAIVIGSNHNSDAYLYYLTTEEDANDAWWYILSDGDNYTISNASSGEYITFTTDRITGVCKGLKLEETSSGSESRWIFTEKNGYLTITNEAQTDQYFNLRVDGTYLLGTYAGSGDDNELFTITDEEGNSVIEGNSSVTPSETVDFTATQGMTEEGEYWERTNLTQPIVYTTDTSSPILYSIVNLRRQQYVVAQNNVLCQTSDASQATHFYFVETSEGIQIYTADGQYVSTSYSSFNQSNSGLTLSSGTTTGNVWNIAWYEDGTYPGYALEKKDNLTSSGNGGGFGGWGGNQQSSYLYWNDYNGNYIGLYDADDGSTFVFTSSDSRHTDYLATFDITFDGNSGGGTTGKVSFTTSVDSLRLNDKQLVYDKTSQRYMMPLSITLKDGGTYNASLTWKMKESYENYSVTLDGKAPDNETHNISITNPTCEKTYSLQLVDSVGTVCATAQLQFTFLPIVEMAVASCNGSYYTTGSIRVTDADIAGYDSTFIAAYKYRGATAQGFSKKAYAIKLRDKAGESVDRSFFGLRSDNNWILDAMAVDPACMRNRVATDLWNDFATPPYYFSEEPKALTGTRGKFVEVLLNGHYYGIYCMTEKVDRKQLKLKKYKSAEDSKTGEEQIRGLLYKSTDWTYEVFMGHNQDSEYFPGTAPSSYKNTLGTESWQGYELKYPDYEEEAVDWKPLWNGINFVATSSQSDFENGLKDYFDYPVLKDYYLFIELLLATDNHGKNMFFFVYDKTSDYGEKIGVAPWDLDGVWGARWDGSEYLCKANQDFDNFLWENEHGQHTIYYKLANSTSINWQDELATRYAELRTNYFNPDSLSQRVANYAQLFAISCADSREETKWSSYHNAIDSEAEYMQTWIADRIEYLDAKYGYDPLVDAINEVKAETYFSVHGGDGVITITTGNDADINIYSISGMLVRTVHLTKGFNIINNLTAGTYIVNGKKALVR